MKTYYITDKDGRKLVKELDSGHRVEILEEPSAEYLANFVVNPEPDFEGRDYLAEIDSFRGRIDDLKARIDAVEQRLLQR